MDYRGECFAIDGDGYEYAISNAFDAKTAEKSGKISPKMIAQAGWEGIDTADTAVTADTAITADRVAYSGDGRETFVTLSHSGVTHFRTESLAQQAVARTFAAIGAGPTEEGTGSTAGPTSGSCFFNKIDSIQFIKGSKSLMDKHTIWAESGIPFFYDQSTKVESHLLAQLRHGEKFVFDYNTHIPFILTPRDTAQTDDIEQAKTLAQKINRQQIPFSGYFEDGSNRKKSLFFQTMKTQAVEPEAVEAEAAEAQAAEAQAAETEESQSGASQTGASQTGEAQTGEVQTGEAPEVCEGIVVRLVATSEAEGKGEGEGEGESEETGSTEVEEEEDYLVHDDVDESKEFLVLPHNSRCPKQPIFFGYTPRHPELPRVFENKIVATETDHMLASNRIEVVWCPQTQKILTKRRVFRAGHLPTDMPVPPIVNAQPSPSQLHRINGWALTEIQVTSIDPQTGVQSHTTSLPTMVPFGQA